MCLFTAELNNLQTNVTDIGNTFLESYTTEKLHVKAGSVFGDLEGHLLIVSKSLYGLHSSSARLNEMLG